MDEDTTISDESQGVRPMPKMRKKKGWKLMKQEEVPVFSQMIGTYEETEVIKFEPTKANTDELLLSLKSLHLNGEYTDFSIKCGNDTYKVHKAIICPRSAFFRVVFANDTKECEAAEVDLSEHDPTAVLLMIYFFYNLDYPHVKPEGKLCNLPPVNRSYGNQPESVVPNLSHHCRVYALAEFCQVDNLKALAVSKFKKEAETHWNHGDFFEAIQFVYFATTSGDRKMRDAVIEVMMAHRTLLDRQEFKDLIKEIDLAYELLMRMHETGGIKGTRNCHYCGQLY